ncbi:N-acetylgalactosamine kinase [Hypsibius exemplaris]|uniref:N-acetylgalactosamine kinase n=1 Tax=Hypsibius exemplaris TaxID=2072580 RepID=A0A9X6NIN1_HYPEX|nr:N-acetylgalactosamine kinase [Hypsibius exemplaris]
MAGDGEKDKRYADITLAFKGKFGKDPDFLAISPGRVNLIGEHIDYHGYSVLPMALTKDILMAVSRNDSDRINLASTMPERYADFSCPTSGWVIEKGKPLWYQYVLCGIKGCEEALPAGTILKGIDVLVDGQVPPNAGLSSSSALVCCSALAQFQANRVSISRSELATLCAKAERYIGTEGGGMDQAISLLAQSGKAKLIDFDPLKATDVTLPPDSVFVVANCCVELNKAATSHYNTRVAEGRVGVAIIAQQKNLNWREIKRAKALQEVLNFSPQQMLQLVDETFHEDPYTIPESANLLGVSEADFREIFLNHATQNLTEFKSKQRLRHVYSEASRVGEFQAICHGQTGDGTLVALGDLMFASHKSCRDDYECSCKELDDLVGVMMKSGAYGARLTGAGWGGCAVALIGKGKEEDFLRAVKEVFYSGNCKEGSVFLTTPGEGARIISQENSVLL